MRVQEAYCGGDQKRPIDHGSQQCGRQSQGSGDLRIGGVRELALDLDYELAALGAGQGNGEMRAMIFLHSGQYNEEMNGGDVRSLVKFRPLVFQTKYDRAGTRKY